MAADLKNVAVTAFASKALEGETYTGMAQWFSEQLTQHMAGGLDIPTAVSRIMSDIRLVEQEMKTTYSCEAMPTAWRSAKSVLLTAVKEEVPFMEGTTPCGKTELEGRILVKRMVVKTSTSGVSTPVDKEIIAIHKLAKVLAKQRDRNGSKYDAILVPHLSTLMTIIDAHFPV